MAVIQTAASGTSAEAAVRGPERAGAAGSCGNQGCQFGPAGHGERDVCAAAAGRVDGLGGDPREVQPSPTGDWHGPKPSHGEPHGHATGKVSGIVYDRYGDFEGFLLDSPQGERHYSSREADMACLIEKAWRERLRITVVAESHEPGRPQHIILRETPGLLRRRSLLTISNAIKVPFPGCHMFIGAPAMPMLWWTATHQSHTLVCTGPATYPIMRPSFWVHTMYSRPWV